MAFYPEYTIIERYPADLTIGFTKVNLEWGIFTNFAKTPIIVNGIEFFSVEQMYHYIRLNKEKREWFLSLTPNMGIKMRAKTFAKQGIERSDWRDIAVDVMRFCLNYKYEQSETFRNELERSKGKYIVEDESNRRKKPDSWGAILDTATNEYYGKNIMGRLLMELREKRKLEYNLPKDIF